MHVMSDECDAIFLLESKLKYHKNKHHVSSQNPSKTAVGHKCDEIDNTAEVSMEKEKVNSQEIGTAPIRPAGM